MRKHFGAQPASIDAAATLAGLAAVWALSSVPVSAQETKTYRYDSLGRLVEVERDTPNMRTETVVYSYDDAGNRVTYQAIANGSVTPPPPDDPPPDDPPPDDGATQLQRMIVFNGRFFVTATMTD